MISVEDKRWLLGNCKIILEVIDRAAIGTRSIEWRNPPWEYQVTPDSIRGYLLIKPQRMLAVGEQIQGACQGYPSERVALGTGQPESRQTTLARG